MTPVMLLGAKTTVVEAAGYGNDSRFTNQQTGTQPENLFCTGSSGFGGTGNAGSISSIGGAGNDTLNGGQAADTLVGDAGADRFVFD